MTTPTKARALADRIEPIAHPSLLEALRSLADQVEALEKDAERYRWLQSNVDGVSWCVTHDGNTGSSDWLSGTELDAAIDRAREAT